MRRTIQRPAELAGLGLHTGAPVRVRLLPGGAGQGVSFRRVDRAPPVTIGALLDCVIATDRRTCLGGSDCRIETVEHLLAAVAAAGVDDLLIELDGPEVPILDGSFAPFLALLARAGWHDAPGARRVWEVTAPFALTEADATYQVAPFGGLRLEAALEFTAPVIGRQRVAWDPAGESFAAAIAPARTFGFQAEIALLQARGLLLGADDGAVIVLSDTAPLNTTLRWPDEFARHKVGDLLGDLALLGGPLRASIRASRPSHRGNIACARAIAARARLVEEQ